MGKKQTKRSKKFQASGGVKKRIENGGTITKHGKLKSRSNNNKSTSKGNSNLAKDSTTTTPTTTPTTKRRHQKDDDLLGSENIGSLDIDSFFDKLSDRVEETIIHQPQIVDDNDDIVDSDDEDDNDNNDEEMDDDDSESDKNSSDDDDDEEDIDVAEAKMKRQLELMEQTDPDFHKFLKDNEKSLLEFGDDDDDDDDDKAANDNADDDDDDEMEDDENNDNNNEEITKKTKNEGNEKSVLTTKLLKQLSVNAFEQRQIKALKTLLIAYDCACHLSDPVAANANAATTTKGNNNNKYTIDSSKVFDDLMVICLQSCSTEFRHHLLPQSTTTTTDEQQQQEEGEAEDDKETMEIDGNTTSTTKTIQSKVVVVSSEKPIKPNLLEKATKWVQLKPLITMYFQSTIHLLSVGKDPQLLSYLLRSISDSVPLLSPFPRLSEQLLKVLVTLWAASTSFDQQGQDNDNDDENNDDNDDKKKKKKTKSGTSSKTNSTIEDYQQVRLNAFFRMRQLALTQPYPFLDTILKKVYLAYAKRSKFGIGASIGNNSTSITYATTALSIQVFLRNCIVELYSIDYHSSYQHSFVYIRQLALLLRTAMQKKEVDDIQNVFCYQYFECIAVWVQLLCSASTQVSADAESELMKSLLYPLSEILYGIVRFTPSPIKFLPARFHCIRLLQQLASASTTFIPTTSLLLDCFDWKEWYLAPKKHKGGSSNKSSTKGILHIQSLLRLPGKGDYLRYYEQIEPCMKELFVLLQREVELYKYSAGFPEFAIRIQVRMRQFIKNIPSKSISSSRYRIYAKGLLDSIGTYTKQALDRRSKLQESPKDVVQLECLLRPNEKPMYERHEASLIAEQKQYIELYQSTTTAAATSLDTSKKNKHKQEQQLKQKQNQKHPSTTKVQEEEEDDDDDDQSSVDTEDEGGSGDDDDDDDVSSEDNDNRNSKKIQKAKKNKGKSKAAADKHNKKPMREEDLLKVTDQVKEGVEWSSDDDDDE